MDDSQRQREEAVDGRDEPAEREDEPAGGRDGPANREDEPANGHDEPAEREDEPVDVALPRRLVTRIEARLPATEFDTADEYVTFAMEEVIERVEADATPAEQTVDEREVQSRLEALGYLEQ